MAPIMAAGGLLWRQWQGSRQIAVIHRARYDDWSLPKGKVRPGEPPLLGGYREVVEETGFRPVVQWRMSPQRYPTSDGVKVVQWWAMRCADGAFAPNHETDELRWLRWDAAQSLLTYRNDHRLVAEFGSLADRMAEPIAIVLLVRHADAGERQSWRGDDRQRPLDRGGVRQARRLADVLPCWAPDRVVSADRLRCRQTVQPLADSLGLPLQTEKSLTEEAFAADPERTMARVRRLVRLGGVSVACSQGGAIPSIVSELATHDGVVTTTVDARKGSTWALTFASQRLVAADYYPDFEP